MLNFANCGGVFLYNMDLYGCGAYGITAYDSYYVCLDDSIIRECTYGCVSIYNSYYTFFSGDQFRDCKGFNMLEFYYSSADFEGCTFENLAGTFLHAAEGSYVSFEQCVMDEEAKACVESLPGFGTQIIGDWESSTSAKG